LRKFFSIQTVWKFGSRWNRYRWIWFWHYYVFFTLDWKKLSQCFFLNMIPALEIMVKKMQNRWWKLSGKLDINILLFTIILVIFLISLHEIKYIERLNCISSYQIEDMRKLFYYFWYLCDSAGADWSFWENKRLRIDACLFTKTKERVGFLKKYYEKNSCQRPFFFLVFNSTWHNKSGVWTDS